MSEQKKPQAGEYWQSINQPDLRCQIVGVANNGTILMQFSDDGSDCDEIPSFLRAWRHLPDCTGWDWEPPAPITTCPDCGEHSGHGHEDVCPMAWVTQDLIPPRAGIDSVSWSTWPVHDWRVADGDCEKKHGEGTPGITLNVRCRRKDLPLIPEPTVDVPQLDRPEGPLKPKRKNVRLFVPRRVLDEPSIDYPVRCCFTQNGIKDVATWVEVKHDGTQFYVEEP